MMDKLLGHIIAELIEGVARVARWFILRSKIPIGVYFGGPRNGNVG
jgi:hypothetical protein